MFLWTTTLIRRDGQICEIANLWTAKEDETSPQLSTQITFFQKETLKNESDTNVQPFNENNALTSTHYRASGTRGHSFGIIHVLGIHYSKRNEVYSKIDEWQSRSVWTLLKPPKGSGLNTWSTSWNHGIKHHTSNHATPFPFPCFEAQPENKFLHNLFLQFQCTERLCMPVYTYCWELF